jgi:hypothetical protein
MDKHDLIEIISDATMFEVDGFYDGRTETIEWVDGFNHEAQQPNYCSDNIEVSEMSITRAQTNIGGCLITKQLENPIYVSWTDATPSIYYKKVENQLKAAFGTLNWAEQGYVCDVEGK